MQKHNTTARPTGATQEPMYTPEVSLEVEINHLKRLASILADLISDGFSVSRARDVDGGTLTFSFQEEGCLDMEFLAEELRCRTKRVSADYETLLSVRAAS